MPQRARRCIWHVHTDALPRISEARWPCHITCKNMHARRLPFHARAARAPCTPRRKVASSSRPAGRSSPRPAGRQSAGRRAYGVPSVRDRAGEWRLPPGAPLGPTTWGARASIRRLPSSNPRDLHTRRRVGRRDPAAHRVPIDGGRTAVGTRHVLTVRAPAFTRHGGRRGGVDS